MGDIGSGDLERCVGLVTKKRFFAAFNSSMNKSFMGGDMKFR